MFCKKCGQKIEKDQKFCTTCGKRMSNPKLVIFIIAIFLVGGSIGFFTNHLFASHNDKHSDVKSIKTPATSKLQDSSEASSAKGSTSDTSQGSIGTSSSRKAYTNIDDLCDFSRKSTDIAGTFKILKDRTLPEGFIEPTAEDVKIEFQGQVDRSSVESGNFVHVDVLVRNLSQKNMMIDSTKFFIHSNSDGNDHFSNKISEYNIMLQPQCLCIIGNVFNHVSDQQLAAGWNLGYKDLNNSLIVIPEEESYTATLNMEPPMSESSESVENTVDEEPWREASPSEKEQLDSFVLANGTTEEQLSHVTWIISDLPRHANSYRAEAMSSVAGKTIATIFYVPSDGLMKEVDYIDKYVS